MRTNRFQLTRKWTIQGVLVIVITLIVGAVVGGVVGDMLRIMRNRTQALNTTELTQVVGPVASTTITPGVNVDIEAVGQACLAPAQGTGNGNLIVQTATLTIYTIIAAPAPYPTLLRTFS
jgi:hypothetical protein